MAGGGQIRGLGRRPMGREGMGLRVRKSLHDYCACFDKLSMREGSSWHLPQENNFILRKQLHPELVEG